MIKVGIVEDNVSLLKNLNIFLGNFPDIKIVFSYTDFAEFEQARRREKSLTPDIVLIDYNENSLKQQISILSRFLEIYPSVKVLVYT